jgi:hypothetical protein
MTVASEGLHAAVVEQRLTRPGHEAVNRHVAAADARQTGRGWRLDKMTRAAQIDAAIALAMAVERAQFQPGGEIAEMALRPCLRCGALIAAGRYCAQHKPRPSSPGRVTGRRLKKRRAALIAAQGGRCGHCGAVGVALQLLTVTTTTPTTMRRSW